MHHYYMLYPLLPTSMCISMCKAQYVPYIQVFTHLWATIAICVIIQYLLVIQAYSCLTSVIYCMYLHAVCVSVIYY